MWRFSAPRTIAMRLLLGAFFFAVVDERAAVA